MLTKEEEMSGPDRPIEAAELSVLARAARLELAADRHEIVGPALNGVLQLFDALDRVEIGETPPTNAFDARWRDLP
jgi:Asp-tRNA(Asn)/Glu-tRNA(Gln) amidotransferase C subunit